MELQEAIKTALEYEAGVHKIYLEAMNKTENEQAKRIFKMLCEEELGHLKYLEDRLKEWQKTGKIEVKELRTSIPAPAAIEKSLKDLRRTVKQKHAGQILELEWLKRALEAEIKTSTFYKEMVAKLDGEGQTLFKRFVEIEDGHQAIVQAEINAVDNWGFWFDTPEFRLENE
jgi:rubrerythrin